MIGMRLLLMIRSVKSGVVKIWKTILKILFRIFLIKYLQTDYGMRIIWLCYILIMISSGIFALFFGMYQLFSVHIIPADYSNFSSLLLNSITTACGLVAVFLTSFPFVFLRNCLSLVLLL